MTEPVESHETEEAPSHSTAVPSEARRPSSRWSLLRIGLVIVGIVFFVSVAAGVYTLIRKEPKLHVSDSVADAIQFCEVDDDTPLVFSAPELPPGVAFEKEMAHKGPGRMETHEALVITVPQGMTDEERLRELEPFLATRPPDSRRLAFQHVDRGEGVTLRSILLVEPPVMTARDIEEAHLEAPHVDQETGWMYTGGVSVGFTPKGGRVFADFTASHIDRRFAIVVLGRVESAPVIKAAIEGGSAMITMGAGSQEEQRRDAQHLLDLLYGRATK